LLEFHPMMGDDSRQPRVRTKHARRSGRHARGTLMEKLLDPERSPAPVLQFGVAVQVLVGWHRGRGFTSLAQTASKY